MGEPERTPGGSTGRSEQELSASDRAGRPATTADTGHSGPMRTESHNSACLVLPDGPGPYPGVVVVHEAFGLNENIRSICQRFAEEGYAALGVDLFEGRSHALCMARMFAGAMAGNLNYYGVPALKARTRAAGQPSRDRCRPDRRRRFLPGRVHRLDLGLHR